jgi:hypothetical protein
MMDNTIHIFRPYSSVPESVKSLSPNDLYVTGRVNVSIAIKSILAALKLIKYTDAFLDKNASIQYYWNNGSPYLCDLVWYYNIAGEEWLQNSGYSYDFLSRKEWKLIETCEFIEHEAPWCEEHANVHMLYLLLRDHAWYKRKFQQFSNRVLDNRDLYVDGSPRKINTKDIRNLTHEK